MLKVMNQQVPEEEVAESLQSWKPDNTAPSGDITISSTDTQEVDNNIISEKSVYFDKNEGNVLRLDDADIGELVNAAIRSQITVINAKGKEILSTEKEANITGTTSGVMPENVRITDLAEEEDSDGDDDEEVIELEFERAVEKVHTHTPYCPNCSSRITKVILRRTRKAKKRPVSLLLKCLSCFSIFIPSGIFGKKPTQEKPELSANNPPTDHGQGSETKQVEELHDESTMIGEPQKPGHYPKTTLPGESGELAIDIPGETGNAFDLFWIFTKGKGKKLGQVSQGNIDKEKSSNDEEENSVDNSTAARPASSLHVPLLHGNKLSDHAVKDEHNESTKIGEPQKPGQCPDITPPGASGELTIDIPGETGTGVTNEQPLVPNTKNGSNTSVEILKCIVYGGLMETIASLSVVSSAAASDATTLNVISIGFATVISGVFLFGCNLFDLKNENVVETSNRHKDKYQELLGTRGHFLLHSTFAVLSFLLFGLMPPVIYGFAFRGSDDKDYKILAVAASSFACILILAITKAYVQRLTKWSEYVKTVLYYLTMAISVSGVSYAAGDLFKILMERLGLFEPDSVVTPTWAFY